MNFTILTFIEIKKFLPEILLQLQETKGDTFSCNLKRKNVCAGETFRARYTIISSYYKIATQ